MPTRLFTVEEANGLLKVLDGVLTQAQDVMGELRHVRDQLVDLRIIWGEKILRSDCPDYGEYERYRAEFSRLEERLAATVRKATDLGCEVKDVEQGLVDFCTSRGEDVVYLCWRKGEPRVTHWHSLTDGFGGRQPLDAL